MNVCPTGMPLELCWGGGGWIIALQFSGTRHAVLGLFSNRVGQCLGVKLSHTFKILFFLLFIISDGEILFLRLS